MPNKVVDHPYPLIDADPHAGRVIRYMRPSDLAVWAGATAAFPGALYLWGASLPLFSTYGASELTIPIDKWDPSKLRIRTQLRFGGLLGFVGGFLMAYQRSSCELCRVAYAKTTTHDWWT